VKDRAPFLPLTWQELDERLLSRASAVVAMQEVHAGNHDPRVIGLRHDMDSRESLATGVQMASWEAARGYRSTYYVLAHVAVLGQPRLPSGA
jgi:dihydrodipicolinate reductase